MGGDSEAQRGRDLESARSFPVHPDHDRQTEREAEVKDEEHGIDAPEIRLLLHR
jgi:hypothetical protein